MTAWPVPETIGISAARLERAHALMQQAHAEGQLPGGALLVGRGGRALAPLCVGGLFPEGDMPPVQPDTIFLVASVTKPYTVAAAMLLVERGLLSLDDPACQYLPEFGNRGKERIRIHHLMTHTSGLPDMLPDDRPLRYAHAPLTEYTRRVCEVEPDFKPGADVQYQSMGLLILAEVVERISGAPLREFMQREIFAPLGMADTSLGYDAAKLDRIARVHLPDEMVGTDWGWQSPYWWELGAPWGGLFTTVGDQFRFMQLFLNGGQFGGLPILSRATVEAMTRDQTSHLGSLPEPVRVANSWGLGWHRLAGGAWPGYFGDLLAPEAYGHGGATGTVVWNDPARALTCVLFTTEPQASSRRLLARICNAVSAAAL